jgi:proteasome lid subunit RPN8/RPN11
VKDVIATFANLAFPAEACGFVLHHTDAVACANVAEDPVNQFRIGQQEADAWWATGGVTGVWHSHPRDSAIPSPEDEHLAVPGLAFYIYSVPDEELNLYHPGAQGRLELDSLG